MIDHGSRDPDTFNAGCRWIWSVARNPKPEKGLRRLSLARWCVVSLVVYLSIGGSCGYQWTSSQFLTHDLARETNHRETAVQAVKELSSGDTNVCIHACLFQLRNVH